VEGNRCELELNDPTPVARTDPNIVEQPRIARHLFDGRL
jgi:hypothetical protein